MKRTLSGVDVPLLDEGAKEDFFVVAIVVLRCMCVVSADGGGGNDERSGMEGRRKALHRKHSPVP